MNSTKVRTPDQLDTYLTSEFVRRRTEVFHLKSRLEAKHLVQSETDALLRGCIVVLYAHWEGYVKDSATAYICFVAMQKLKYRDLAANFVAIGARNMLNDAIQTNVPSIRTNLVKFLLDGQEEKSQIAWEKAIDTESNLSSTVFRNIVELLGLDYSYEYETRQNMIDNQLLRNRHKAAHGDMFLDLDVSGFGYLYDGIFGGSSNNSLGLMTRFRNQLVNAALLKQYLRNPAN